MQICRSASGIEILAPAKINLFFEVLTRRDDGYHEIETLMVPIGLYDTLLLEDDPSGRVTLTARWAVGYEKNRVAGGPLQRPSAAADIFGILPKEVNNHALRAVRLLAQKAGISRGAKLRLIKRIPAAAGLGGGSSDAAAALLAANVAWNLRWSTQQLAAVAAEIGSDVPFFLTAKAAICRGRGERIQVVAGLPTLHFVVIRPPEGLSTKEVYEACRPAGTPLPVDDVIGACLNGNIAAIGPVAHNQLLEPARGLSPWVNRVLQCMETERCPAIGMSGSGTSCFAVCVSALHARRVAARLRSNRDQLGWVWTASSV